LKTQARLRWVEPPSRTTDYGIHEPDFSGTTTGEWTELRLEDFDTDDVGE
jgi:hypothetical protein